MKIGILTMHRVVNYGSFLQAYALKKLIEETFHGDECEIEFIDIKKGRLLYKEINNTKLRKLLRWFFFLITGCLLKKLRRRKLSNYLYNQFEHDFYPMLGKIAIPEAHEYDIVVIGSDEVFNCCQVSSWGFTTQLYGNIPNAKKIISYAASFGGTTLEDIYKFNLQSEIINSLNKMSNISVRDENSKYIVEKLLNKKIEMYLDPVLIYGYKNEIADNADFHVSDKYLIVYSYFERVKDKKEISAIIHFAKKNKLKIYTIFCGYSWADKTIIPATPFKVLNFFQNAEYIISDTFHGTIFSVITHKKFCTLIRQSNSSKINSLMKTLGLENHIVYNPVFLEEKLTQKIDFDSVDSVLQQEREHTKEFLSNTLNGI